MMTIKELAKETKKTEQTIRRIVKKLLPHVDLKSGRKGNNLNYQDTLIILKHYETYSISEKQQNVGFKGNKMLDKSEDISNKKLLEEFNNSNKKLCEAMIETTKIMGNRMVEAVKEIVKNPINTENETKRIPQQSISNREYLGMLVKGAVEPLFLELQDTDKECDRKLLYNNTWTSLYHIYKKRTGKDVYVLSGKKKPIIENLPFDCLKELVIIAKEELPKMNSKGVLPL